MKLIYMEKNISKQSRSDETNLSYEVWNHQIPSG